MKLKLKSILLMLLCGVLFIAPLVACQSASNPNLPELETEMPPIEKVAKPLDPNSPFIQVQGDKLMLGEEEFRFASHNTPNLHYMEDPAATGAGWHAPTYWEQEDTVRTVYELGGRVLRTYTLSVAPQRNPAHITGPGQFNEDMFVYLDQAIELCAKYGVYMIIPFVDNSHWWGGIESYLGMTNQNSLEQNMANKLDFYTNSNCIDYFKQTISYVLNRTNTITGVKYKDDPTIMCWELGNELYGAPVAWVKEMSAYVKSIDSNHLLMDGASTYRSDSIDIDEIDILTAHYYRERSNPAVMRNDYLKTKGKKPFIIGEFGMVKDIETYRAILDEAYENGTAGIMSWALRSHSETGGFYFHADGVDGYMKSLAYHYPGFEYQSDFKVKEILEYWELTAYKMSGLDQIEIPIPDAPLLLSVEGGNITFRGSTGAYEYEIYASASEDGEYTLLQDKVTDCNYTTIGTARPVLPIWVNPSDTAGTWYKVKAISKGGKSDFSNAMNS